ncbi:hypothetical protein niasHS_007507 [Heterodera schachtii]|uniref:Uncharacterized protein n=1 Tax=Heterodera schachtii TaxID=97005 RepID=A0ABD2JYB9_HETSC
MSSVVPSFLPPLVLLRLPFRLPLLHSLFLLLLLPLFSDQLLPLNSSSPADSPRCPSRCSCAHSTVICAGLALSHVPKEIPPGTTRLDLQENRIRQIRLGDFDGLNALRTLHIGDNSIEQIEKGSLDALTSLERLRLSRNKIRTLPEGVFSHNKRLRRLDLSENALWSLSAEHLAGPDHLASLQLDHNQLQCVDPLALTQWHSLESLSLASNALSTLSPLDLMALPNLRTLRLSDNPWHCDCRLRWLKRLKIAPQIRCYRPTHLFGRPLNQISSQQLKCSGLEKRASGGGRKCRDTERCPPGCVCTESAPDAVVVDCHDRLLRAVPQRLPPNTVELRLEQNRISRLENDSFSHVPNLIRLDLSKNAIERVEPAAFAGLGRLSSLMLFSNNLTDLPERVFDGIGNSLQVLLMNGNQLECLRNEVFRGLNQLKLLSLYDNKIRSISQATFAPFARSLQTLHLARNPLICDCNLVWMALLLVDRPVETSGARCHSPKRVAQRRIATLSADRFRCVGSERLVTQRAGQCEVDRECPEECQCRGTTVDCSSLHLSSLPAAFPRFTTSLLLRSNRLSPRGSLLPNADLPNLVHLDLSDNQINALPPDFLSSVPSLRELDLSENSLRQFSAHSLGPSALNLITLQLDGNALRCVPLGQFPSLRSLSLRQNPLNSLDGPVFEQLELLGLDGSARFICDCQLRPLIRRLRKMGKIWTNEWEEEEFGGPRCAEPENLRGKGLSELEEDELICQDGIPGGQCSTEGEFCPSGCSCVRPSSASSSVAVVPPLLVVRCSGLGLSRVPIGIPEDTTELFLDNNRIEHLSGDSLARFPQLIKLDLSHNLLRHIRSGTFVPLSVLSTLILAFNRIQCLHNGAFDGLSQLRVLSLHQNDLSQLSEATFVPLLANLSHIALSANPFWCDCQMNWAIRWVRSKFIEPGIAKCEGPPQRKGFLLLSADPLLMECPSSSSSSPPISVLSKCRPCLDRSLCGNLALCHSLENGKFRCECPLGFHGTFCEHPMENYDTKNEGKCENKTATQSFELIGEKLTGERKTGAEQRGEEKKNIEVMEEKKGRVERQKEEDNSQFEMENLFTDDAELTMPRKGCPFAFTGINCTERRAIGLSRPNAFVQLSEWRAKTEENGGREVALLIRSKQRSGVLLFAGDPSSAFVLLELVHGRLRAAVRLAPVNSPPAQLFSLTNVDDGLPHSVRFRLHGRRLLLLLDSLPILSTFNAGPVQLFPVNSVPLFIGGIPIELGRRSLINFCLSDISSIRGCFMDIRVNGRPFDLNLAVLSDGQSPISASSFGCSEAVDLCAGRKCEGKRKKCQMDEKENEGWKCVKEEENEEKKEEKQHNRKRTETKREQREGRKCSRGREMMKREAFWIGEKCSFVHSLPSCLGNCAGNDGDCCVPLQKRKRRVRMICGEGKEAEERWRMVEVPRKCGCLASECRQR